MSILNLLMLYAKHSMLERKAFQAWERLAYSCAEEDLCEKAFSKYQKENRSWKLVLHLVRFKYGDSKVKSFRIIGEAVAKDLMEGK